MTVALGVGKVEKRDGTIVDFEREKIERVIKRAFIDVPESKREDIEDLDITAKKIVDNVEDRLYDLDEEIINVETIQDIVEEELMLSNYIKVAKEYIIYREFRRRSRNKRNKGKGLLSEEFLSKYKHQPNPFPTELGEFIYYRTYSRWLPDENRREYWWETVKRAVEYNCSLAPTTRKEAEELYDNIYNLNNFLAGRTLWTGGTEASRKYPMSNFNCAFMVIDSFKAFEDLFYLLLVGSGVGDRVLYKDVDRLAPVRTNLEVKHEYYTAKPKDEREELTSYSFEGEDTIIIEVGDSKEAWVQALKVYLEVLRKHEFRIIKKIYFNYDSVRPKGERLKTFGGHASGHQSIKRMFEKIDKLMKKKDENKVNLTPLDCLDIANIIGENVVSGGVRRTSEIGLFNADNENIKVAKNDLFIQEDGEWKINKEIEHRQMSNNSIFYEEKPSREQLNWHIKQMRFSGEPGFINAEEGRRRRDNFEGVNPCFTGDMELLTEDGYKRFDELVEKDVVRVVNKDGDITDGKVWSNGIKDIVELSFYNKQPIRCTPDHVFMTIDGREVQAKDLREERLLPFFKKDKDLIDDYIAIGFMQGDGGLGRLDSDTHRGVPVYIGENDDDIKYLFTEGSFSNSTKSYSYYTREYQDYLVDLEFDSRPLYDRELPFTFEEWSNIEKRSFLKGLFSANGSVIGNTGRGRITLKSTSERLINQVKEYLDSEGYDSYITVGKPKVKEFYNGEYLCKTKYCLNIGRYEDKIRFYQEIGFVHKYKEDKLIDYLVETAPYVKKVEKVGREEVYDFNEPKTHWGVVEGVISHNCGEILLDDKGMCNLVSLNSKAFVDEEGNIDKEGLFRSQRLNVHSAYRMAMVDFELPEWDYVNKRDRLIGLSITGWQDAMNQLGWNNTDSDYIDSDLSVDDIVKEIRNSDGYKKQKDLLEELRDIAHDEAKKYSKRLRDNEPVLVTTVKPEGTQTQMPTVSSGLHYNHSPYYIRRVRINADDPLVYVAEDLGWNVKNDVGQDEDEEVTRKVIEFPVKAPDGLVKKDVSAIEQLETYRLFMKYYVDHNASITVHVRDNEWDMVEEWLWKFWDDVVGVSFISYSDNFYDLMPYEEIDEETYDKMVENISTFKPHLVNKYEQAMTKERELEQEGCESGICPVR